MLRITVPVAICAVLLAQAPQQDVTAKIDAFIQGEMKRVNIPGVSLAVVTTGQPPLIRSYGLANVEHQVPVKPETIRKTALFTVEGELDDISGNGQTEAAHTLCRSIPADRRKHLLAQGVGHYGIFSGRKFRELVYPQIRSFVRMIAQREEDLKLVRVK